MCVWSQKSDDGFLVAPGWFEGKSAGKRFDGHKTWKIHSISVDFPEKKAAPIFLAGVAPWAFKAWNLSNILRRLSSFSQFYR